MSAVLSDDMELVPEYSSSSSSVWMFSLSVFVSWRSSGGSTDPLFGWTGGFILSFCSVNVGSMLFCCVLMLEPVGCVVRLSMFCCCVTSLLPTCCGGCLLSMGSRAFVLFPIGVDVEAGIIVMVCSSSGSVVAFFGEFVIFFIILSIFASLFDGLSSLFLGCAYMNALGLLDVRICSGLSCDESDARLMICTELSRCSFFMSSWISGDLALSFWRCFAFSNFVCARAASFERISNSLLGLCARFVGAVPFRLGCLGAFASWVLCEPLGPGWSFCSLLSPALLGPGWSIWNCDSGV